MHLRNEQPLVEILLSIYNGERFLRDQLDSLLEQSYKNWRVLFRDDGSSDASVTILTEYARRYPDKFLCVDPSRAALGVVRSYSRLLAMSTAPFVMFCDQDDVWLREKIDLMVETAVKVEGVNRGKAILVHTDLVVVDSTLNIIAPSMWEYQKLNVRNNAFTRLLLQNNVTGCAMMVNSIVRDICGIIPDDAMMHDWWLALVAACFGEIVFLSEKTVLYRQHGQNRVGANRYRKRYLLSRLVKFEESKRMNLKLAKQARAFAHQYGSMMSPALQSAAMALATAYESSRMRRVVRLARKGFSKSGLLRTLGFYVSLFCSDSTHSCSTK
ncbi:MAG: glycosyltransferase family 2 protein [Alicyclobacillus sp.]|nr:glycosyltransferase family 2 protein [Alicyclobacillus sp.]